MRRIVLSIDGGGIRGLMPAMLLAEVEREFALRLSMRADLLAGTSTGGIIAAGLYSGVPAKRLVQLYAKQGPGIFHRSPWQHLKTAGGLFGAKYNPKALERALEAVLGGATLSRRLGRAELMVPTYCIALPVPLDLDHDGVSEESSAYFFKSWEARAAKGLDFTLVDVCRATSAAPSYFPPAIAQSGFAGFKYTCVDGGVHSNNPAADAFAEARKLWPYDPITVISLGTGSKVKRLPGGSFGVLYWGKHVVNVLMDGVADVVSYQCRQALGDDFVRVETAIPDYVDEAFDCASPANIAALMKWGDAVAKTCAPIVSQALRKP